ncbi:tRNA guanosine-2'-O-methyltransferase [Basidiobolus meristosporus CBS 931.73]|uniref:tRNA guanosine-2'-O-methyltransferase n=1 Tax=Basidiobolus meristosporus CBS 931.73 TaxID=1314790 RepID=A0A1Y1X3G1_9FUNG|nr:tRNA guanosine-2'-O-methyltransferase [Basidiobolus meristosporus CBS 931.73]|eukprot:ORX80347.1 tRNA guanosine-2'-O-methyltransferase [Basidiobolus meristosporus CBS 931.73]
MPQYLIQFAQAHDEFRLPELHSLMKLENVHLEYDPVKYDSLSPFLVVNLANDEEAYKLVQRAILIKGIYELWAVGETYEEVHEKLKASQEKWPAYSNCSFKFTVDAFGGTRSLQEQIDIINTFSFLGFEGPIDLKNPQAHFRIIEDYGLDPSRLTPPTKPYTIYMGRQIALGKRDLIDVYNLKKRKFIGNTSMDAELSLVMANQALATKGKLVYDPFVGTGSFLVTCAHFGALTMGSDIDGRQIRGKGKTSIRSNVEQYALYDRVLDTAVFDICRNPWRQQTFFDAIVTGSAHPPYGVRAGAKRLGRKNGTIPELGLKEIEGVPNHLREDYYPPTVPYEMSEVLQDLLEFAARFLNLGGRLVYWLPTVAEEYSITDVPQHPCMELIANSEQPFGTWSRRLITMEKVKEYSPASLDKVNVARDTESEQSAPSSPNLGHSNFREKYFTLGGPKKATKKEHEAPSA